MTTQTTNYSFTKDDINEPYDVLRVNANLDAIDTEIKKKETQIGDKANLVTVTKTNLVAAINEVKEQTNNFVTQENWIASTLLNGWVVFATGLTDVAYYKNSISEVKFKGTVSGGTATNGTVIFTLPVGYRPIQNMNFVCRQVTGSGETFALIRVGSNGNVTVLLASNQTLTLDGISFRAEQ